MLTEVVGKCSGFIRRGTNTYVCIFSVQARSKSDWKAASNWDASSKPWLKNQNGASQTSKTHSSHVTYPKRYRWRRVCEVDTQDEAKICKNKQVKSSSLSTTPHVTHGPRALSRRITNATWKSSWFQVVICDYLAAHKEKEYKNTRSNVEPMREHIHTQYGQHLKHM